MAQHKRKAMKKNPDYNLEKRRPTFLFVGLMASLALTLVAFDWTTYDQAEYAIVSSEDSGIDIEVIKPHIIKKPEPVVAKKATLRKSPVVKVVKEPTEPFLRCLNALYWARVLARTASSSSEGVALEALRSATM